MKVQNIAIFVGFTTSFQIATMFSILKSYEDDMDDGMKIIEAFKNWMDSPEFKVYLSMDTREVRSMMKISLPANKNDLSMIQKKVNLKKIIVFLIHGFISNSKEKWLQQLSEAYLKRKDAIVFIVDWGTAAMTANYKNAVEKTRSVAKEIISFIDLLIKQLGVKASNIHLIGHSLGAHIAGFVGKDIPHINRITGLDPANPGFQKLFPRLSKTDATYVDVIHTSIVLGNYDLLGDIDFYINGGETQPGCQPWVTIENYFDSFRENTCSHNRAINYFIESIDNPDCNFVASKTIERANKVRSKDFDPKQDTILGLDTFKHKSQGKLYITTNDYPPYCRR